MNKGKEYKDTVINKLKNLKKEMKRLSLDKIVSEVIWSQEIDFWTGDYRKSYGWVGYKKLGVTKNIEEHGSVN